MVPGAEVATSLEVVVTSTLDSVAVVVDAVVEDAVAAEVVSRVEATNSLTVVAIRVPKVVDMVVETPFVSLTS